jgi:hypothetical protein
VYLFHLTQSCDLVSLLLVARSLGYNDDDMRHAGSNTEDIPEDEDDVPLTQPLTSISPSAPPPSSSSIASGSGGGSSNNNNDNTSSISDVDATPAVAVASIDNNVVFKARPPRFGVPAAPPPPQQLAHDDDVGPSEVTSPTVAGLPEPVSVDASAAVPLVTFKAKPPRFAPPT